MPKFKKELLPNKENIFAAIQNDVVGRNKNVAQFVKFCNAQEENCAITLEASWGMGKTFFVKECQFLIDSYNDLSKTLDIQEKEIVKIVYSNWIKTDGELSEIRPQATVYYDAWANDSDSDPMLSLIYSIMERANESFDYSDNPDFAKLGCCVLENIERGKILSDVINALKGTNPLEKISQEKKLDEAVAQFLESLLKERGDRLVIFVDELDRCRPSFAVELLERIKHYFTDDHFTFVFSVNLFELQHTIKKYYGEDFDACKYLDRFFDYRLSLPEANMESYNNEIGWFNDTFVDTDICNRIMEYYHFGLREREKFTRWVKIALFKYTKTNKRNSMYRETGLKFGMCVIAPIIICLRMQNNDEYSTFVKGENPEPLLSMFGEGKPELSFFRLLLNYGESYDEEDNKTIVRLNDKLTEAYNAIFKTRNQYEEISVGGCLFDNQNVKMIKDATSFMSEFANFEE